MIIFRIIVFVTLASVQPTVFSNSALSSLREAMKSPNFLLTNGALSVPGIEDDACRGLAITNPFARIDSMIRFDEFQEEIYKSFQTSEQEVINRASQSALIIIQESELNLLKVLCDPKAENMVIYHTFRKQLSLAQALDKELLPSGGIFNETLISYLKLAAPKIWMSYLVYVRNSGVKILM